jgi:integrase
LDTVDRFKSRSNPSPQSSGAKPKYLHKRGGVYYFKRKIPVDIAHGFPEYRDQVWKSLGSSLLHRAKVYLAVEVTEFDLKVALLRKEQAGHLARTVDYGNSRPAMPKKAESTSRNAEMGQVATTVVSLAASHSKSAEPDNLQAAGTRQRAVVAEPSARRGAADSKPVPGSPRAESIRPMPYALPPVTMLHLLEDWKLKQTRPRTVAAVEKTVVEFRSVCGSLLQVQDITKGHARAYRDHLIEQQLSRGTIENRLGFLSTLVRHGMRELVEDLVRNPFEGVEVIGAKGLRAPKERRAFSIKELNLIFSSRLYTQGYRPEGQAADAAYWVPLLGPFVGCRIEELCQLRLDDVQRINGSWCIRICDLDDEQQMKTFSSFRRVPLHESVIRSGFLAYAAQIAAAGHDRVFPTLSNDNANKIFSNSVGKWWGRYLDSIGLDDPRLDYHSFRYNFKQQCSLCGVSDEVRDALSGHWIGSKDAGRAYLRGENKQYSYPKLVEAIGQLCYDELDIEHLHVSDPLRGVEALLR